MAHVHHGRGKESSGVLPGRRLLSYLVSWSCGFTGLPAAKSPTTAAAGPVASASSHRHRSGPRTKMSLTPLVSAGTKLEAKDSNATNRPSAEMGWDEN